MKNNEWNREFPEVPDSVHQSVLNTLAGLEEQKKMIQIGDKKMKKIKTRTMIILAAVLVIVLGTTVAAAELFKWNEKASDIFEAEPELQNKLVMEEIAQDGAQSVADNGLTITAVQTIQDSNCFYALFEVAAADTSLEINADCGLDYQIDFQGAEDPFAYMGWGFVDSTRQEPGNSRYFEIFGTKMKESAADLKMNLNFTALTGPGEKAMAGEVLVEGNWSFSLTIHPAKSFRFDLNRECQIAGCSVFVESIELSPLTGKLSCKGADIKTLMEKEGVDFDKLDVLNATNITGIKYQDGTILDEDGFAMLWEQFDETESYVKAARLSRVIEPEKVSAILLGNNKDEITLQ